MIKTNKHTAKLIFILPLAFLMLFGCKTTRYVPEDKYLLKDIDIKIDNDQIDKEEVSTYLRQKENLKILALVKFHLWLYNLSNKNNENGLFKRIGEPPVIYDMGLKDKSVQQIQQYLYNKGYYQAIVDDTVTFKNKKATVTYNIKTGDPYTVRSVTFDIKDKQIAKLIAEDIDESLIQEGGILDVDQMRKERTRITTELKNKGYYNFADEFIHFKIDSTYLVREADVEMIVERPVTKSAKKEVPHKKYIVADYEIFIDKQKSKTNQNAAEYRDTTVVENFTFYHNGEMALNKSLLIKSIEIKPGETYTKKLEDKTYNNLYALRQFKFVNIQYSENTNESDSLNGVLHGRIFLPMQVKQNYSIDMEATNTGENLGIAGNLNYQHRNLLGGAEIFDISVKGARERQDVKDGESFTKELGGQVKITVPGIILPYVEKKLNFYSIPFSSVSVAVNSQDRWYSSRNIVNATLGFNWRSNAEFTHYFNLIDLNAVYINRLDEEFINGIQDVYIRSSYTTHFISSTTYSLVFSDQSPGKLNAYHYFRLNLESAGNTLNAIAALSGREKFIDPNSTEEDVITYYRFFETRFAQYFKADFDFRYGYKFDKYNSFATRAFIGTVLPYGNFNVTPPEKSYFSGGANGIRAWQVRTLGPGSSLHNEADFPNQLGDIKLEANVEYRFKLFWMLEGAFFADAGNIWAINHADDREGAIFQFNSFYKEIALGSGFGVRLVSPYFVVRADLGFKLRDPMLPEGERFIHLHRAPVKNDFAFNIAIGYPF